MGAKYRPHDCPSHLNTDSRSEILAVLREAVSRFVREAETRVTNPGCMRAWQSEVDVRIAAAVAALPDGTLLTPVGALPYSPSDRRLMSNFLHKFVCTPMDKAADTFVFQCPKVYITDIMNDLKDGGTYEVVDAHSDALQRSSEAFIARFGLELSPLIDISLEGIIAMHARFKAMFGIQDSVTHQSIPYYKLTRKMHKDPIGARYISSSENSSLLPISKGLCGLLQVIQSEVGQLFGSALQSMSISEQWTARSWVITDVAHFIPLVHIWNAQYASQSPEPPQLLAMDCERLYTKIDMQDLRVKVLDMVGQVFNLPEHQRLGHVAVKIRETKHAVWLKAPEVPSDYHARTGSAKSGGDFIIFDLAMIDIWVTYLLENLFIMFGDVFARQAIGAPMGSNCSGELVNL